MIKFNIYSSYIKSCYIGKALVTTKNATEAARIIFSSIEYTI